VSNKSGYKVLCSISSATYVLVEKKYLVFNMKFACNFFYKHHSRHMRTETSDFHVIYPHFLSADIEMLPENRSQCFLHIDFQLMLASFSIHALFNQLSLVVIICTTGLSLGNSKFCLQRAFRLIFNVDLRKSSNYFSTLHYLITLYSRNMCLLLERE
jgi:hypothetical protein